MSHCVLHCCVILGKIVIVLCFRYVKDKRPTISPNFNFLGQLLEFEKELRSCPMDVDRPGTSDETSVKKQRMDVGSGARLDFDQLSPAVVPLMVSPVTAFSQLNFNHLSPLSEYPSPSGDEQRSKVEGPPSAAGGTSASLTSSVVIRLGSKHSLKRPLSGPPCDTPRPQCLDCGSVKRPLARPRSITLPSTIQPAPGLCTSVPTDDVQGLCATDAVEPSELSERCCEESTAAADSADPARNIPATSESDSPSETTVDQCPINSAM